MHTPSCWLSLRGLSELKSPLLATPPEPSPAGRVPSHMVSLVESYFRFQGHPALHIIEKIGHGPMGDSMHPCMPHLADPFPDTSNTHGRGEPLSAPHNCHKMAVSFWPLWLSLTALIWGPSRLGWDWARRRLVSMWCRLYHMY